MSEITLLLDALRKGEKDALEGLFSSLYSELKTLARSQLRRNAAITLTPTALVNEAWMKLDSAHHLSLNDRQHFFACAATAMRQIAIDTARASMAKKRGKDMVMVTLTEFGAERTHQEILALDDALGDLDAIDSELRKLVELRFFAGLSMEDIAELNDRSVRSLHRDWTRARAFLHAQLVEV
ncbi:MAG: ECF-type sigma factor [Pseudomonadota bacterium]